MNRGSAGARHKD
jgi:hypothetical protein